MNDNNKKTVRRFCVWHRMYGETYLSTTIFNTREDAAEMVARMPARFRVDGDESGARVWEQSEHVIVEAEVEAPQFAEDAEGGEA